MDVSYWSVNECGKSRTRRTFGNQLGATFSNEMDACCSYIRVWVGHGGWMPGTACLGRNPPAETVSNSDQLSQTKTLGKFSQCEYSSPLPQRGRGARRVGGNAIDDGGDDDAADCGDPIGPFAIQSFS